MASSSFHGRGRPRRRTGLSRTELLLAVALALLIGGSAGLGIYYVVRGPEPISAERPKIVWGCQACGHQFPREYRDIPRKVLEEAIEPDLARLDCPSCGASRACLLTVRCPKCGKHYVPDRIKELSKLTPESVRAQEGPPPSEGGPPRDVCPHCGTDRYQWMKDRLR